MAVCKTIVRAKGFCLLIVEAVPGLQCRWNAEKPASDDNLVDDMNPSDSITLIDGLIVSKWSREVFEDMHAAKLTAANCTVSVWEGFRETVDNICSMKRHIADNSELLSLVRNVDDIEAAKRQGKTGIILGFQNAQAFEDNLGYIEVFADLGVRVVQLTYNTQNLIGTGCYERDSGLSGFGREVIQEMNRVGIVIDLSHVGTVSARDTILESLKPVCYSHCLPLGMKDHPRNKSDVELKLIAEHGGFVGVTAFPPFMKQAGDATIDDVVGAMDYVINLIGEDAVGFGSDFVQGQDAEFFRWITHDKGRHRRLTNMSADTDRKAPKGLERISDLAQLPVAAERAGWSSSRIEKVMGKNWVSFFQRCW